MCAYRSIGKPMVQIKPNLKVVSLSLYLSDISTLTLCNVLSLSDISTLTQCNVSTDEATIKEDKAVSLSVYKTATALACTIDLELDWTDRRKLLPAFFKVKKR